MPEALHAHIRVLVVEDEPAKLRDVMSVVRAAAGSASEIVAVHDAHSARLHLVEHAVDLAIVDLFLPEMSESEPERDGGLRLLEDIVQRDDIYKLPSHVVGLTAYEEAFEAGREAFDLESWSLILYDSATNEWRDRLARKTKQILLSKSAEASSIAKHQSFACVLTALDSPELSAVLAIPWNWETFEPRDDVCVYHRAEIPNAAGPRIVYAATAVRPGIAGAASLAMKMIQRYRPQFISMVGITAGIRGECNQGDIIVADPSWHWESGKHYLADKSPAFAASPHQLYIKRKLRNRFDELRKDHQFLAAVREEFKGVKPDSALQVKIGPMASGSAVLNNESFIEMIRAQDRKALAVEMEAYGVYTAAEESDYPQARAFCIKGVSDFADGTKDDRYRDYAAHTSARALQRLVEKILLDDASI